MTRPRSLLVAALGSLAVDAGAPELQLLHRWLDSWTGVGLIAVGLHRQGVGPSAHAVRRRQLARDVLRHRSRALHRRCFGVGADGVAGGSDRGVGGGDEQQVNVGVTLVLSTVIGLAGGFYADRWLGTAPWLTMIGLGVGIVAGFVNLFRSTK
jgi:hypothetical protein